MSVPQVDEARTGGMSKVGPSHGRVGAADRLGELPGGAGGAIQVSALPLAVWICPLTGSPLDCADRLAGAVIIGRRARCNARFRFTGTLDRFPDLFADCLIGSPITWHHWARWSRWPGNTTRRTLHR